MKNRTGAYKKDLLNLDTLGIHKNSLLRTLESIEKYQETPVLYAGLYLILFLRISHPKNWLQRKSTLPLTQNLPVLLNFLDDTWSLSAWEKSKLVNVTLEDLFLNFNLKSFPASINRTMLNWMSGTWQIELFFHVPSARELLILQAENKRCITLVKDEKKIDTLILNKRDPLSFALHDMMHIDQYFNSKESSSGQLGFYRKCVPLYQNKKIKQKLKTHSEFKTKFEYVTSDMNAYSIHLFKCLKHALVLDDLEETLFQEITNVWLMNSDEKTAASHLNTNEFNPIDELILKSFFEREILV